MIGVFAALLGADIAHADPAGPTDYRTEVLSIEPAAEGIRVDVIGGDSFVQLTVDPGVETEVAGYFGEPYLWFLDDGTVLENRNSPTTYQNEERYGTDAPEFASAEAEPEWEEVADDGSYAWHDHRAHWMQPIRPAGREPGDRILEQVIPVSVDGVDVDITVISVWLPEPSPAPLVAGAILGIAAVAATAVLVRRNPWWAAPLTAVALWASVAGVWQYTSLPSETGPRLVWAALPVVATVAGAAAIVASSSSRFIGAGLTLVGAAQLVVWASVKRDGLGAAIVPTDAPQWLDRSAVVAAFVAGVGVGAVALRELFRADAPTSVVPA